MAKREIGVMGYIGELIVEQWLRHKFPSNEGYKIVNQIMPEGIVKQGGPYLDFGVIRKGEVYRAYEVKTQDYIFGRKDNINLALSHVWKEPNCRFVRQEGDEEAIQASQEFKAFLILLVAPNDNFIEKIGQQNIKRIVLFEDILNDPGWGIDKAGLINLFKEDVSKVIKIINEPKSGRRIRSGFYRQREEAGVL